jgi:hypothetical protein
MTESSAALDIAEFNRHIEEDRAALCRVPGLLEDIAETIKNSETVRKYAIPLLIEAGVVRPDIPY